MIPKELKEKRKELFDKMEEHWNESNTPEDDLFYHHASEDRIVLFHAIFWVMTNAFPGSISKEKFFLLIRQFQEEMLDDMDFYHNRVKCGKIDRLVPTLNKLVEQELRLMP